MYYFTSAKETSSSNLITIGDLANILKSGKFKDYNFSHLSNAEDKSKLPGFTTSHNLSSRQKDQNYYPENHTGFIIIDIDNISEFDIDSLKVDLFSHFKYCHLIFTSPSKKGLKLLCKVNKSTISDNVIQWHKSVFLAIASEINSFFSITGYRYSVDPSGKDINRFTYLAHDPKCKFNFERSEFIPTNKIFTNEEIVLERPIKYDFNPKEELSSELKAWIENTLQKRIEEAKYQLQNIEEVRHQFRKDISKHHARGAIATSIGRLLIHRSLNSKEINELKLSMKDGMSKPRELEINWKNTFLTGIERGKQFRGEQLQWFKNQLEQNEVPFGCISPDILTWDNTRKKFCIVDPTRLSEHFGFYSYSSNDEVKYCQKKNDLYYHLSSKADNAFEELKKFIKSFDKIKVKSSIGNEIFDVESHILSRDIVLSSIPSKRFFNNNEVEEVEGTVFKNGIINISKNDVVFLQSRPSNIWEHQIVQREYNPLDEESIFEKFCKDVMTDNKGEFSEIDYKRLITSIGYLLSPKIGTDNPAILFTDKDSTLTDANGRTGKTLVFDAISHFLSRRETVVLDGKRFAGDKFRFSPVSLGQKVVLVDDIIASRELFDSLYVAITKDFEIERKGLDKTSIPYLKSPKILLTTNSIKGMTISNSDEARFYQVRFSNFFSHEYTPVTHFKHMFFTDWDNVEWNRFDNFMTRCIKTYLQHGLIKEQSQEQIDAKRDNEWDIPMINTFEETICWIKQTGKVESESEYLLDVVIHQQLLSKLIEIYSDNLQRLGLKISSVYLKPNTMKKKFTKWLEEQGFLYDNQFKKRINGKLLSFHKFDFNPKVKLF